MTKLLVLCVGLTAIGIAGFSEDGRTAKPVDARPLGVGRLVPDFKLSDIAGRSRMLSDYRGKPVVLALTSTTCPVTKKYGPTLSNLEASYKAKGVQFVYVNPSETDDKRDMVDMVRKLKLSGPYVDDPTIPAVFEAKTTAEVFLIDGSRTLRYRGAIDDQYAIGASLDKPRNTYLINALDNLLAGREIDVPATYAPGCVLPTKTAKTAATSDTYHGRISRIIQDNCLECHRTGGVGPFSLDTYREVKGRAEMIKYVVEKGIMPPWFAADSEESSPWKNDKSLSKADKAALLKWLDGEMPEGDPKEAPAPRKFYTDWKIGKPDAVFEIPRPIKVKSDGVMPYQEVVVPTNINEDKWVQRLEVQPTARQVVHHVLIFVQQPGQRHDPLEEVSGFFAAYVPGSNSLIYPDGFAKFLPAGSSLRFQIHYTPNGAATEDQTRLGLVFAKEKPKHEMHTAGIVNFGLVIPPNVDNHEQTGFVNVPFDAKITALMPHMHVRGKACRYDLIAPDGKRERLLDVPRYDFNWQLAYNYREPKEVKKGSKIEFIAWYDNSDKNPHNPDPSKTVRWGLQTYDEMHLGYVEYFVPGLEPGKPLPKIRPNLFQRRGGG